MDVSIIIVSYNSCGLTLACIASLVKHTEGVEYEIIVADNASGDGTADMIEAGYKSVRVIRNGSNMGFSRANNAAARVAKGKYLFFLNSDTVLLNNAVRVFFDFHEGNGAGDLGVTGGILLNRDMTNGWSCGRFNTIGGILVWYYGRLFDVGRSSFNLVGNMSLEAGESLRVDYVTGADMFIAAKTFNGAGGFDERFFLYFEDEELQFRLTRSGYAHYVVGGARIVHFEGGSRSRGRREKDKMRRIGSRSLFYYWRKCRGRLYAFCGRVVYRLFVTTPLFLAGWMLREREGGSHGANSV